jgi:hypothetical protein
MLGFTRLAGLLARESLSGAHLPMPHPFVRHSGHATLHRRPLQRRGRSGIAPDSLFNFVMFYKATSVICVEEATVCAASVKLTMRVDSDSQRWRIFERMGPQVEARGSGKREYSRMPSPRQQKASQRKALRGFPVQVGAARFELATSCSKSRGGAPVNRQFKGHLSDLAADLLSDRSLGRDGVVRFAFDEKRRRTIWCHMILDID